MPQKSATDRVVPDVAAGSAGASPILAALTGREPAAASPVATPGMAANEASPAGDEALAQPDPTAAGRSVQSLAPSPDPVAVAPEITSLNAATHPHNFVAWLREVAPYVHRHRGRTFVVAFGGVLLAEGHLNALIHDLSLLHALGISLVVVHGSRPQVQEQMAFRGLSTRFAHGMRITDAASLNAVKEAAGGIRLDIEAAFSQGLPNTPMANSKIRVVGGNFVTAKPVGIVEGVNFEHTGVVRRVDSDALRITLANNAIVLLSPLGYSPTGESFNLQVEDVAASVAIALQADKLIFLCRGAGIRDADGELLTELAVDEADQLLKQNRIEESLRADLGGLIRGLRGGVSRGHLLPYTMDGGLLLELFTHGGVGTMITNASLEAMRVARPDDVGGIIKLIAPLEADGTLVKRPRERIERDIAQFSVLEHDGLIVGCAALIPFNDSRMAEMACLTVHPAFREDGMGERLLAHIETRAKHAGIRRLFVLTTRTAHWFLKRGFVEGSVNDLPDQRRELYNWHRRSQVFIKNLLMDAK